MGNISSGDLGPCAHLKYTREFRVTIRHVVIAGRCERQDDLAEGGERRVDIFHLIELLSSLNPRLGDALRSR